MRESSRGFTNQQALLVLLICFPVGLIALGVVVILLQGPTPRMAQSQQTPSQEQPSDRSTTIQPLPSAKPPADQQSDVQSGQQSGQQSGLNQLEARAIVEQWLTVKSQIFAPPFNVDLADQVVADGPLWTDITKTDGSIQWLRNNNSYYSYTTIKVNEVISFLPSPSMPSIVVSVTEASILHSPNGNKASSNTNNWLYTLREEGGRWKIWDYRKQ